MVLSATNNTNNSYCKCGTKKLTCRSFLFVFLFSYFCEISYWKKTLVLLHVVDLCLRSKVNLGIPWNSSYCIFHTTIYRGPLIFNCWFLQDMLLYFLMHRLFFDNITIGLLRYFSVSPKNSWKNSKFFNLSSKYSPWKSC